MVTNQNILLLSLALVGTLLNSGQAQVTDAPVSDEQIAAEESQPVDETQPKVPIDGRQTGNAAPSSQVFTPSEDISEDTAVDFPIDI